MMGNSVERWDGLRLWVYRTRAGQMPCALIMRYSRGGQQNDTLLGRENIGREYRELAEKDPYAALLLALVRMRGAVFVQNELREIHRASAAPSPVGDHGGTEEAIDTEGKIKIESPPPL